MDKKDEVFVSEKPLDAQSLNDGVDVGTIHNADQLHRKLGNREIQLIAIGGSIGTALFVSIAGALNKGGPASLFLAYGLYSCIIGMVNNCMAEMATYMPVSGGFIRMAGHWVDEAFGFMAGWNFFFFEALLIPFEISALNVVLGYWRDDIPVGAVVAACIVLYFCINFFAVRAYGESEFWLSIGKVILLLMVFSFTFITMVGGNPQHDAYGFRYWNNPGAFAEYLAEGNLGRFEGFLGALWAASFAIVGPEYLSMVAGEAKLPRRYMKNAYKVTYLRFALFFVGSAIAVGIVIPYNDPTLVAILAGKSSGSGTASASPYVIACGRLGITALPSAINALLVTSIFSAGNAYTYCGTRSLYGLALEGQAPAFLKKCTKSGVPIYCLLITICFPFLAFLNLSNNGIKVLNWLIDLITAAEVLNFMIICVTYIFFFRALKAQGIDRNTLPYTGWCQPYSAYFPLVFLTMVVFGYGYSTFLPGSFTIQGFFTYYTMLILCPIFFIFWKVVKRTKFISAKDADLTWDAPIIDAYEAAYNEPVVGFWKEMIQMWDVRRYVKKSSPPA